MTHSNPLAYGTPIVWLDPTALPRTGPAGSTVTSWPDPFGPPNAKIFNPKLVEGPGGTRAVQIVGQDRLSDTSSTTIMGPGVAIAALVWIDGWQLNQRHDIWRSDTATSSNRIDLSNGTVFGAGNIGFSINGVSGPRVVASHGFSGQRWALIAATVNGSVAAMRIDGKQPTYVAQVTGGTSANPSQTTAPNTLGTSQGSGTRRVARLGVWLGEYGESWLDEISREWMEDFGLAPRKARPRWVLSIPIPPPPVESSGSLPLTVAISGQSEPIIASSGSIVTPVTVSGSSETTIASDGSLSLPAVVSGQSEPIVASSGLITSPVIVSGQSEPLSGSFGSLAIPVVISGWSEPIVALSGSLVTPVTVSGQSEPTIVSDGSLLLPVVVSGLSGSSVASSGSLVTPVTVSGSSEPLSGSFGSLTLPIAFTGQSEPLSGSFGSLTLPVVISGSSEPIVASSGSIALALSLSGFSGLSTESSGSLSLPLSLLGSGGPVVESSGSLSMLVTFVGSGGPIVTRDLIQAIVEWYHTHPSLHLAGGLWLDAAEPGTRLPYAVLSEISTNYDHVFGPGYVANTAFQVNIFASTDAEARAIGKRWIGPDPGLHRSALPVTEGTLMICHRVARRHFKDPDRGPDGKPVHIGNLEFAASIDTPES